MYLYSVRQKSEIRDQRSEVRGWDFEVPMRRNSVGTNFEIRH